MNEVSAVRESKSGPESAPFWTARPVPGSAATGLWHWWACSECHPDHPRRGCPVCEGTGQYAARARPTIRQSASGDDRERGLAWIRTIREGQK